MRDIMGDFSFLSVTLDALFTLKVNLNTIPLGLRSLTFNMLTLNLETFQMAAI